MPYKKYSGSQKPARSTKRAKGAAPVDWRDKSRKPGANSYKNGAGSSPPQMGETVKKKGSAPGKTTRVQKSVSDRLPRRRTKKAGKK